MRTQEEIVAYYKSKADVDWLGTIFNDCATYLDIEHLRPLCKPDADFSNFKTVPLTREAVLKEIRDYLPFAWEKANNERGISASRSIDHFRTWAWLLGDEELTEFLADDDNYSPYGKPMLQKIQDKYGVEAVAN